MMPGSSPGRDPGSQPGQPFVLWEPLNPLPRNQNALTFQHLTSDIE